MPHIIYDVAVSIDGFIAGPAADISKFAHEGPVVEHYYSRLEGYAAAIMGRQTYEFGYRFGLTPGANPYPHMDTYVFSRSMTLPADSDVHLITEATGNRLRRLKAEASGPVYLVGGGHFASAVLADGLLDQIVLKRAPIIYGTGTPLFDRVPQGVTLRCTGTHDYGTGYLLQHFDVQYADAQ